MQLVKCRYCSAVNAKSQSYCSSCRRPLEGSVFTQSPPDLKSDPAPSPQAPRVDPTPPKQDRRDKLSLGDILGAIFAWLLIISFVLGTFASCMGLGSGAGNCRYGECDY